MFFAEFLLPYGFVFYFGLVPKLVMKGYLWQLVTFVFLHGGLWHLLMNLLYLWQLGTDVEKGIGVVNYIKLIMFCVVGAGVLMSVIGLLSNPLIPIIGSSVINYGIIAAFIYLFPRVYLFHEKIRLKYILIMLVILSMGKPLIFGHLGAMLIGYLFIKLNTNVNRKHKDTQINVANL
jgi:membrane associated rhomboid family serine protease